MIVMAANRPDMMGKPLGVFGGPTLALRAKTLNSYAAHRAREGPSNGILYISTS